MLIIAGLFGNEELSAEIALTQGAILAIFLSLSGNARNLILGDETNSNERGIFHFRLIALPPAIFGAFYLANSIIDVPILLVIGLILRKSSEWFAEIQLASKEKSDDYTFVNKYVFFNALSLIILLAQFVFPTEINFYYALYFWAVTPDLFLLPLIYKMMRSTGEKFELRKFIPHLGSSTIVGTATYIFRLLIVILVSKALAGKIFTAYALGGLVSAVYTYALGPTMISRNKGNVGMILAVFSGVFSLFGLALIVVSRVIGLSLYSPLFVEAVGFSIIGGGVMLVAQHQRLHLLQTCKQDVFVPDALANILFLSSIPFVFYVFGETSLGLFFLWSALLNLMFYTVLFLKQQRING